MKCEGCQKETEKKLCKECDKELKKLIKRSNKIWEENEDFAIKLGFLYYDQIIEGFDKKDIKNSSKEEFGFNTFCDGLKIGLGVFMPLIDDQTIKLLKKDIDQKISEKEKTENKH